MKKNTIFLIAMVVFFPLNNMPSYAKDAPILVAENFPQDFLFDLEPTPTQKNENALESYLNDFSIISPDALKYALSGYSTLKEKGKIKKQDIITIVDFSKPSTEERLFVLDLKNNKIITKSLCAHGKNSGELWATKFSNKPESYQSSLGFYICNETYNGSNGFSLKLDGQEPGINDNARERGVVIHGADYVSKTFIANNGKIGRSFGCPALPIEKNAKIINLLKGGSCLFIYQPNKYYQTHSSILKHYDEACLAEMVATL
ncbi:MAG: murein L,D-transpeptidase catalytic domain family protein [Chitinophagales bacterium]